MSLMALQPTEIAIPFAASTYFFRSEFVNIFHVRKRYAHTEFDGRGTFFLGAYIF